MPIYFLTGASRGIGLELARELSKTKDNTVITAVRSVSDGLKFLQNQNDNIKIATCDISSLSSISSLATSVGDVLPSGSKITHLINNAAIVAGPEKNCLSVLNDALNETINVNVLGPAKIVDVLVPFLAPNATILNISSGIGSLELVSNKKPAAKFAAYSISKAALNMMAVHQAQEYQGRFRVLLMDPGWARTKLGGENAELEPLESARGVLSTLKKIEVDTQADIDAGVVRFYNFLGETVPW
ncbi:NAD(P)-binding protein [Corynespora cassiicola Philippines]|uniref:NAD(P)-binding protein n=1 Tax=Corynespora cassiicola Philippines TaxID=1448308 RepID=A0A2T2PBW4_CORCC|nr:NAD(P)-binding protein [Corynespora cassiicola Philippines]